MLRGETHIAETRSPIRQCVGCRSRQPQSTLLRIAAVDGRPIVDPGRRLPGRGAYVHHRSECLDRATKRGSLARALRIPVDSRSVAELGRAALDVIARHAGLESESQETPERSVVDRAHGRPGIVKNRPIDGLTQPEPRFVVGTPQSKDQ